MLNTTHSNLVVTVSVHPLWHNGKINLVEHKPIHAIAKLDFFSGFPLQEELSFFSITFSYDMPMGRNGVGRTDAQMNVWRLYAYATYFIFSCKGQITAFLLLNIKAWDLYLIYKKLFFHESEFRVTNCPYMSYARSFLFMISSSGSLSSVLMWLSWQTHSYLKDSCIGFCYQPTAQLPNRPIDNNSNYRSKDRHHNNKHHTPL
jgi:hypothetical protein